jgi:hypothetical protein
MMILAILARERIFGGLAMGNWFVLYFENRKNYSSFAERTLSNMAKFALSQMMYAL